MKFKSALVTQASGSVGGLTASRNRGGPYFRGRAVPVNPATQPQQDIRAIFAACTTRWRDVLSNGERDAWDQYAELTPIPDSLGDPRNAGGLGMYVRGNAPRRQAALSFVDAGPPTTGVPSFTPISLTSLDPSAGLIFAFTTGDDWVNTTGSALLVYLSRGVSVARNFFKGPFQYAGRVLGSSSSAPTSPVTFAANTLPFTITPGLQYFVRNQIVTDDGRTSFDSVAAIVASGGG